MMLFNVFRYTPLGKISTYLLFGLSTIGHLIFISKPNIFSKNLKTWYFIGVLSMLISMASGTLIYNQSLISGIVANSQFYNIGSVMLLVYLVLKSKISFIRIFPLLSSVGWVFLGLIAFMAITNFSFINESQLTGEIVEGHAGKVSKNLTNFIALYWLAAFLFKSNYKYLLYSILFFSANHFFELQRFMFFIDLLIIAIAVFKMRKSKASLKFILPLFFCIAFLSIYIFNSIKGASIIYDFTQTFELFSEDSNAITDSSVSVRVSEIDLALTKFTQYPLFGNGYYRASEGGKVIGEGIHFYVSDIGIVGILFNLGIFGVVLFLKQIKLVWKLLMSKQNNQYQFFMVLALIFLLSRSLLTGYSINNYDYFFLLIAMLQLLTHSTTRVNDKM